MSDKTYNGWTNYETWRVNLEIFDGFNPNPRLVNDLIDLANALQDYAIEIVLDPIPDGLAKDYANAFLNEVNWYQIAEHLIEEHKQEESCE
jgi:hypothetical protein